MDKMSNMSGPFHFTRSFYVDLADPEFDSISSPTPAAATPTLPINSKNNSFAPKSLALSPSPHATPPRTKTKPKSRSTRMNTQPKPAPPPTKAPAKVPFSDCADANKISGYTQVRSSFPSSPLPFQALLFPSKLSSSLQALLFPSKLS